MTKTEARRFLKATLVEIHSACERTLEVGRAHDRRVANRPSRSSGPTKEEREARLTAEWDRIKAGVRARSGGRCELVRPGLPRCGRAAVDCDHFWQGANRIARQSVESCWDLCREDHDLRQANTPTRRYWVDAFEIHVLEHGLQSQVPLIEAERARLEGKGR